jgi:hypothetical protein
VPCLAKGFSWSSTIIVSRGSQTRRVSPSNMATVMPRLEGVRLVVYSFHVDTAVAHTLPLATGCFWPILLKKSAMVSTAEKYAIEIEIFTLSRGFRAQISRSGAQKRRFQRSVCGQSGRTDFFNRIGRKRMSMIRSYRPEVTSKRVYRNADNSE